ncbi:Flagellar assembly protein FliH [Burkholderiales bacterium 8X]|nr:Flagellar assembly protein FliH [Burkholderiales bacterium 8X]
MARSSFIPAEQIAAVAHWQFATVGVEGVTQGGIADPEAIRRGHDEGYALGFAAGQAEALAQCQAQMDEYIATQARQDAERFAAVIAAAEAGLANAQQDIARGTLEIACALARQVLRHELATRPDSLQPVVHEALGMLMTDGKSACVRLSPADYDRVQAPLSAELAGQSVQLVADAKVAPGDCLIESAGAVVDGGVATRWSRAVASLGLEMPWNEESEESIDAA